MLKKLCAMTLLFLSGVAMAGIDVNKASEAELDSLNGIGPATTQLILKERKKGEFKDWPDLMHRVKGIGDARAAKLSAAGLTVSGASYKDKTAKDKGGKTSTTSADDKSATLTPAAVKPADKPADKAADKKTIEGKGAQNKP